MAVSIDRITYSEAYYVWPMLGPLISWKRRCIMAHVPSAVLKRPGHVFMSVPRAVVASSKSGVNCTIAFLYAARYAGGQELHYDAVLIGH